MRWYKAEIRGRGVQVDAGATLPDEKLIHYVFQAEDDDRAVAKAKDFAMSPRARQEFWLYDPDPKITVSAIVCTDEPLEEGAWLAN